MRSRKTSLFSNPKLMYLIPVLIVVVGLVLLELTGVTHLFHKTAIAPVIPVTAEPSDSNNQSSSDKNPGSSTSGGNSNGDSTNTSALPLNKPSGNFVSNHHPNLNGSPAPSEETSVCNTTPGATCYIRFTKGGLSTSLPSQSTDSNGASYWTWDVKKAGLTTGDWKITAVAVLNDQTKTTSDPLPLTVSK